MRSDPTIVPNSSGRRPSSARVAGSVPLPGVRGSGWLNLGWKLLLSVLILLLMSLGTPVSWAVSWSFLNPVPATLLLWGALLVGVASANLFDTPPSLRWAWGALAVGAYIALALPTLATNTPSRTVDAIGPVAALTLVAHLGRRDLQRALRDWALVIALSLYAALGVMSMWLVIGVFSNDGPLVFLLAVLLPPILFEALLLVLRGLGARRGVLAPLLALLLSTLLSTAVVAANLLNRSMQVAWMLLFGVIVAVLIGSGLFVSYLTRPLVEASSGGHGQHSKLADFLRAFVELSHGPILISLALYIPLRLLR